MRGGKACRPLIARDGLSHALIEPALALSRRRAMPRCASASGCARSALRTAESRRSISATRRVPLDARRSRDPRGSADGGGVAGARSADPDRIPRHRECAFPPRSAGRPAADDRRARTRPPSGCSAYPGRLSTTTSGADRLLDQSREELAATIWREVAAGRRLAGRHCRPGRSCASAARPSRRRRRRTPSGPARHDSSAIFTLRETGPTRACPRPSKVPFDPATGQPIWRCSHSTIEPMMTDTTITFAGAGAEQARCAGEAYPRRDRRASSPSSSRTATGCSSSRPTPRSRPNTC